MSASSAEPLALAVRQALAAAGDPGRAVQQQRYMKSALPFHGISSPGLKALLRPLLAEHRLVERSDWESAVLALWDGATHREERYAAIALLRHRRYEQWLDVGLLPLLHHLVVTGAWWDVVDEISQHLVGHVLARHRSEATEVMRAWATEDDLWVRRSAVLCQNRHRAATDTTLLEHVLDHNLDDSPHGRDFFIRKALGWALREYARTDAQWVRDYVSSRADRLSGLTRREALKHLA